MCKRTYMQRNKCNTAILSYAMKLLHVAEN